MHLLLVNCIHLFLSISLSTAADNNYQLPKQEMGLLQNDPKVLALLDQVSKKLDTIIEISKETNKELLKQTDQINRIDQNMLITDENLNQASKSIKKIDQKITSGCSLF